MNRNELTGSEYSPIADLVTRYKQAAEGTSNSDPKQANESHDDMHAIYKQLRLTEVGRAGISGLLNDVNPHVRCWAAAHSLAWASDAAQAALRALRDAKGACSFDAETTLSEFQKGRLSFEY